MDNEITIKITIPESEYKDWHDYDADDIATLKMNLRKGFSDACRKLYIRDFEIEVDSTEE